MLGHAKLSTTELYTRVSTYLVKQVYFAAHPGAHLKPPPGVTMERNCEADVELFAALDAEAAEDAEPL